MKNDKTKKKVLYVITKSNWGGAQRYVYDLATQFHKDSWEVSVAGGGNGELFKKLLEKKVRGIIVPALTRDISLVSDAAAFFMLWKIFRAEKPDIVHLNSSKAGFSGALAARLAGVKKIIFTAHGWPHNDVNLSLFVRKMAAVLSFLTVLFANRTIAVSEAVYRETPGGKLLRGKVTVIKNGIPISFCLPQEDARQIVAGERAINIPHIWVGTIAELHPNKGLRYAIEALALYNNSAKEKVALVVIGEGEEREKLITLINKLGLFDSVFLPGKRTNAAKLLAAFNIFLSSSLTEAFGYVLLEAGLAGLPVVATKVGGTPEIIENMKSGILVEPKNPEAIAEAIKFMIDNPEKRKGFSKNLKEKIEKDFRLETMIEKTLEIYSES